MFAETNDPKEKFYAVRRVSREALDGPMVSHCPRIGPVQREGGTEILKGV